MLLGVRFEALCIAAVGVFHLAPTLAIFRPEEIAQNREQPSRHVCTRLERRNVCHGPQQRFLDEVVRAVHVAAQRNCERSQTGNGCKHCLTYGGAHGHQCRPLLPGSDGPLASIKRSEAESVASSSALPASTLPSSRGARAT